MQNIRIEFWLYYKLKIKKICTNYYIIKPDKQIIMISKIKNLIR